MHREEILGDRVFIIKDLLDEQMCEEIIERAEDEGFEVADVLTDRGAGVAHFYRNHMRSIFDDPELAEAIMARLAPWLPRDAVGDEACGLNERMRVQFYRTDEHFRPHIDGIWTSEDGSARSQLTLLLFLNDAFEGGQTRMYFETGEDYDVEPQIGQALVFEHDVLHEGRSVTSGEKFLLRTDVMYPA